MKTKKLEIIQLDGEKRVVDAFIIGDLALHPSRMDPKKWTVTHVPTLMSFKSVVPVKVLSNNDRALTWMKTVQSDLKKDWLAMRKFTRESVLQDPDATKTIRARIRAHCLSIKE